MAQEARPAVTPLAIAVLALLEEQPMHPYEMYQLLIARREDRIVKVRPGSLYHTVARLADQQLVRAEGVDREGNRPERTTYRITGAGRTALRARITEVLRRRAHEFPVFPLALAEAHNLPKPQVLALMRERLEHLEQELADLELMGGLAGMRQVPRRYWLVVPYQRTTIAAEAAWVREFIADLDSGDMAWEEFDPDTGDRISQQHHDWSAEHPESAAHLSLDTRITSENGNHTHDR